MTDDPTSAPGAAPGAAAAGPAAATSQPRVPLRAWVALAVMLATVAGAGYLMYERLFGGADASRDLVDIVPLRGIPGIAQPPVQADGVRAIGSNSYQVKAGDARVNVRRGKPEEPWAYNFTYVRRDLITPEQDAALTARWRLPRDPAFAKSLNVTPEQIKQLEALPGREGMIVADADRARVASLFEAYLQAAPPREAETTALVDALRDVGERSLQPTRDALADRAAKIQAVLTPEQLAKFRRPGN